MRALRVATTLAAVASLTAPAAASAADACPNAALRQGPAAALPDCRAFELASALDKAGGNVAPLENVQAAPSGNAIMYPSTSAFADPQGAVAYATFVARRGTDGWSTVAQTPPELNERMLFGRPVLAFSSDLTRALALSTLPLAPGAQAGKGNIFLQDTATRQRTFVGAGPDQDLLNELGNASGPPSYGDASDDFKHVVFWSNTALTPDSPANVVNVYEIVDDHLRLVNVRPDGTIPNGAILAGSNAYSPSNHAISRDGRRIFFFADGNLFVREDGTRTLPVSASQRQGDDPVVTLSNAVWGGASADGHVVYFSSNVPLVDDAADPTNPALTRVYRWQDGTLEEIAAGSAYAPATGVVSNVSEDGKVVYFTTPTALSDTAAGSPHVYRWTAATGTRLVAAFEDLRAETGSVGYKMETGPEATSISPSGRYLMLETPSQLTAENTRNPSCGFGQSFGSVSGHCQSVYVYDAAGSGTLRCVSCDPRGSLPVGQSAVGGSMLGNQRYGAYSRAFPAVMFDDGTAYFDSDSRLTAGDTDGHRDAYSWRNGTLTLLTPGTATDSVIADVSADQRDVFFNTSDRLVGADRDDGRDVYDARAGGGLPAQHPAAPAPPCVGDACQGAAAVPTVTSGAPTELPGAGDAPPVVRPSVRVAALTSAQRRALAKGNAARVRVTVATPGTVTATLSARVGGVSRRWATAHATATKAGTITLTIRLTAAARASLRKHRTATATLTVRQAGARAAATTRARLERPHVAARASNATTRRANARRQED